MKRILALVAAIMMTFALCGCSDSGKSNDKIISGNSITPMPTKAEEETTMVDATGLATVTATLVSVDSVQSQIIIKDIYDGSNYVLSYNGGTDVRSLYDNVITMEQLDSGEIVDVSYDVERKKAKIVKPNKDVFRTNNVRGFKATYATSTITFGSASYMYTDNLVVLSGGMVLTPAEVMSRDVVTVRGIDNKIYSVTVDKGHGYLTFTGADEFIGGMVEIGTSFLYTVSEDMMIVVPEGKYEVTMSNGSVSATKNIYIAKDMTVTMDFSEYKKPVAKTGTVEFQILPKGTDLFIEGNATDYSQPVVLDYGTYIINLLSDDYDTYTTRITVDSTYQVEKFDLSQLNKVPSGSGNGSGAGGGGGTTAPTTVAPTTARPTVAPTTVAPTTAAPTTATTGSNTNETPAVTTGSVKVTISEPAGAGVYVNNVYVGTAPVTINKDVGEYVITFKRSGYITKSYIVDVDSSDGAQTLSFPAMSEE